VDLNVRVADAPQSAVTAFRPSINGLAPEPRRGKTIYETGDESKRKFRRSVRVTQHAAWFAAMQ
jgi:hypothetical protein